MSKFSPEEVEAILCNKPQRSIENDVSPDFFKHMEERILAAVAKDTYPDTSEASCQTTSKYTIIPVWIRRHRNIVAAAAILLFACAFAMHHSLRMSTNIGCTQNIYAITDEMSDDDIEDLDDFYHADLFLEEL